MLAGERCNQNIILMQVYQTKKHFLPVLLALMFVSQSERTYAQTAADNRFPWPEDKLAAISISFDDGRLSQVDTGLAVLDQYGVKATFLVLPGSVEERIEGWKKAVASGHEIGNHSLNHPCTGNFAWSRQNALEDYTLAKMDSGLAEANSRIQQLLDVKPEVFAYPCGQTFIGRGRNARSYVPLVAERFIAGRGWLSEGPNDPAFCDFAQLTGMEMDGKSFDQVLSLVEEAKSSGSWLILAGHEMGESGPQTTSLTMLKKLMAYAQDKSNRVWIAPIGTVTRYIQAKRKAVK